MWAPVLTVAAMHLLLVATPALGADETRREMLNVLHVHCTRSRDHELCSGLHRIKRSNIDNLPAGILEAIAKIQLPGTKWCGRGSVASNHDDLGEAKDTDRCCRAHDECPVFLEAGQSGLGLVNTSHFTVLGCSCEGDFFSCLERTGSAHSFLAGELYFNSFDNNCIAFDPSRGYQRGASARTGFNLFSGRWPKPSRRTAQLVANPWGGLFPEPPTPELQEEVAQLSLLLLNDLLKETLLK